MAPTMDALLFGSIGSIAETSEMQRHAFNAAFKAHGLDWVWEGEAYRQSLASSGGAARIAAYAKECGEKVDAIAVHATKNELFHAELARGLHKARDGVVGSIELAKDKGLPVGLASTTHPRSLRLTIEGAPGLTWSDFAIVTSADDELPQKPDPSVFLHVAERLGLKAANCVAIEDNPAGVAAAKAAGMTIIAMPGANTRDLDYRQADVVVTDNLADAVRNLLQEPPVALSA